MGKFFLMSAAVFFSCGIVAQADEAAFNTGKISAMFDNCPSWELTDEGGRGPWVYLMDKFGEMDEFAAGRADSMKYIDGKDKAELEQDCEEWLKSIRAGGIMYFKKRVAN